MASQAPTTTPARTTDDYDSPEAIPATAGLARHNTSSSTGSALRRPHGNWAINISGVCPRCHHYHRSLQVHVRISDDSTQVGDVYCKKCQRLWLASGNANGTRLSLLSTISIEPDPIENEFHSTLVHMIRSITPIAVLSPTLTVIPEATSASPSRETSVRSITGRGDQRPARTNPNDTAKRYADDTVGGYKYNKHSLVNGRRILSSVTQKARARLFKSRNIPFGLGKWFSKESLESRSHEQSSACAPVNAPPTTAISPPPVHEPSEVQEEIRVNFDSATLDVSASSANATDALASLKALDPQALQSLPHEQQISWARRQLTDFRARHSSITAYMTGPNIGNSERISRRHSALDFVGSGFNSHDDWSISGEYDRTLNGRPLSMSDTNISEADTLVDGMSISSSPYHIFVGALHRDPRRSLSPGRLSMRSAVGVQDWSQIRQSRAEARRSIDSTATGGAVRSITTSRNHVHNRLSRNSVYRTSSVYGTEPTTSRVQLRLDEEAEENDVLQRPRSPSPSPPTPEINPRG